MPEPLKERGLLTRGELAAILGVVESTIAGWEVDLDFPVIRLGNLRLYDMDQVADFLRKRSTTDRARKRETADAPIDPSVDSSPV